MARFKDHIPVPGISGNGEASNDSVVITLLTNTKTSVKIRVEAVTVSVIEPAQGGGGILEFRETDGTVFFTLGVDSIMSNSFLLGAEGLAISAGQGVNALVSGAADKQAKVSIIITGYLCEA